MERVFFFVTLAAKNIIPILGLCVYSFTGILVMFTALYFFEKVLDCSIKEELKDRNFSVGLSVAALFLGTALIISSVIGKGGDNGSKHPSGDHGCGTSAPQQTEAHSTHAPLAFDK